MPRKKKTKKIETADYRHDDEKRKNIPPAKIVAEGEVPKVKKAKYYYSPHLSPEIRLDSTGKTDKLLAVCEKAGQYLNDEEKELLNYAVNSHQPWLEWADKREQMEKGFFDVDPVALHIHERISAQAIIRSAMREDLQRDLFADPELPYQKEVQFYQHDVDWANRLILGDSLQVMSSLERRENLAGEVQMIYIDPPYGIKFKSNFQIKIGNREVKDGEKFLTREPEMVKAYRDTWNLGVHSYLSYLKERLLISRRLLKDTGSIFVQIGEENVHKVRQIMDSVFGVENYITQIAVKRPTRL
ncbi:DNA methyltransferase, partial [Spirochaetota bacterium]